ncbi:helix-turn-helix domain-containing protein [Mucilaginibacter sp. R-33]|uniref:helix-turn-helix domain-containing protein n=1 Tax=Mucilaginibacter sp. R-33 TaxID=3416711 RepID=UPI003CEFBC03
MFYIINMLTIFAYYIKHYEATTGLLPKAQKVLNDLGENKLARLRRKLSTTQISEQAGISWATLWQIEKGTPTVAMGAYLDTLHPLVLLFVQTVLLRSSGHRKMPMSLWRN